MSRKRVGAIFADAQLQPGAWANRDIQGDAYYSVEQIVNFAMKHRINVYSAGDLFDKQRNRSSPVTFMQQQLYNLAFAGCRFEYIDGNHDKDDPSWLSGLTQACHIDQKLMPVVGSDFTIYGLDYRSAEELPKALEGIHPKADILLCHQAWSEWMGHITLPQGDLAQIPYVTKVFSGDYHKYTELEVVGNNGRRFKAYSPGATSMQSIDEDPQKVFMVLWSDGLVTAEPLKCRPLLMWPTLLIEEDIDDLAKGINKLIEEAADLATMKELPAHISKPLFRVTYAHNLPQTVRRVTALVNGRAHLFWKELPPEPDVEPPVSVRVPEKDEALSPLTCLPEHVNQEEEPEVYGLVERMLRAPDRQQAFAAWRQEYLDGGDH